MSARISRPTETPQTRVVQQLDTLLKQREAAVQDWLENQRDVFGAPFYSSVDLRHAGFKLAPVDTNLFPAGFNNLSAAARVRAAAQMQRCFAKIDVKRVLVIPENHTRNLNYLENLVVLQLILQAAGVAVEIGSLLAEGEPLQLVSAGGTPLTQYPLLKEGNRLSTSTGFVPDLILLNNDLTSGLPEILRGITQPIAPRPGLGWHRRRKSIHFDAYDKIATEFALTFDIDPWLLTTETHRCGHVNFADRQGLECVALGVERVLARVRAHYTRYGITQNPYVFIKSDAGTYGMGIMTAHSGDEVMEINKKGRNKMSTIKEGVQSTEVIIQEGVPTACSVDGFAAEPMLYLVRGVAVGGAYRVNRERDSEGNLNASGMYFAPMCDETEAAAHAGAVAMPECSFGAFGLVAALAALAATQEEYGENYAI